MQDSRFILTVAKMLLLQVIPHTDKENYVLSYCSRVIYMVDGKYDSVQNPFSLLFHKNINTKYREARDLLLVLYGCETKFSTLSEEKIVNEIGTLHNVQPHNL